MKYEKQVMKIKELVAMGFPKEMLMNAYRYPGQRFAQKIDPAKKNSPIVFNTEEFDKWLRRRQKTENKSIERG